MDSAPGPFAIQAALAAWSSTRARLLAEDADLANDEAQLVTLLGEECDDLTECQHRLARAIVTAQAMAESADTLAENLIARRDRYRKRVQSYKAALLGIMDATGERRSEFADCTVSTRIGPPAVIVTDESQLPLQYWRVETSRRVDKAAIGAALRAGEEVDGATLGNGLTSLSVRSR